jgi:hypothetical protein
MPEDNSRPHQRALVLGVLARLDPPGGLFGPTGDHAESDSGQGSFESTWSFHAQLKESNRRPCQRVLRLRRHLTSICTIRNMTHISAPAPTQTAPTSEAPWYQRPIAIGLLLVFIPIVGIILLLVNPRWSVTRKLVILAVVGLFFLPMVIGSMASSSQPATRPPATSYR